MNHPYREANSLIEECANARTCWTCERRLALAREGRVTRCVSTVVLLVANFACASIAFACARFGASMVASANLLEREAMATIEASRAAERPQATTPPGPEPPASAPLWPALVGILKLSETEFVIDRRVVDVALESQAALMRMTRIVPETEGGKVIGVRLFGVRSDTLLGRMGFENGDRLESVNGLDVFTPEHALEAYSRYRSARDISVILSRRDSRMKLEYHLL
jgi:hypothetical protein